MLEAVLVVARWLFLGLLSLMLWQLYSIVARDLRRAAGGRTSAPGKAPAADLPTEPSLILAGGRGEPSMRYRIGNGLTIGRSPDNDIVVADFASSHHARVWCERTRCYIQDLGSTNGTVVNGRSISGSVELAPGAAIEIGGARFRFER